MDDAEKKDAYDAFHDIVNMSPSKLDKWLDTPESRGVGMTQEGEDEAVGHREGRRIVEIKRKRKAELTDDDYAHIRKVVGYVDRHRAQGGPAQDKEHSPWRYSSMNWGHDPLLDGGGAE